MVFDWIKYWIQSFLIDSEIAINLNSIIFDWLKFVFNWIKSLLIDSEIVVNIELNIELNNRWWTKYIFNWIE